jgi:hypothetical protein
VRGAKAGKAPGEDGIPLEVRWVVSSAYAGVKQLDKHVQDHWYLDKFVPQRGKSDYQLAKSYRPVALLNTLGKFLESIVARRISYAVESEALLPRTHLGGRRGISTDHAIHIIIDRIKTSWG